ncbi:MAG: metal ABC transporter permease [Planctomycetaceae bacterium]|nr:metal ABC transporter permease [Planctomycetaceae bacterium]
MNGFLFSSAMLPVAETLFAALQLPAYNTQVVLAGTFLLGVAAAVTGTFMLLRGQALAGDVVSHATLAGVVLAFMVAEMFQAGSGRSLAVLLTGAFLAGGAAIGLTTFILRTTRIRQDAAMAISLGVFYGLGISLLTVAEDFPTGNVAGLSHFLEGMTASLRLSDVQLIGSLSLLAIVLCGVLFKELRLLSFDRDFAATQGWPVGLLDLVLIGLIVLVAVVGLKAVGAVLVVALLIIPPAAARFWSDRLSRMILASAVIGGASAVCGTVISTMLPSLAAGAVIVLSGAVLFCLSLAFGTERGLVWQAVHHRRTTRRVDRQHLLRAVYEIIEQQPEPGEQGSRYGEGEKPDRPHPEPDIRHRPVNRAQLQNCRRWVPARLERSLKQSIREGMLEPVGADAWQLTEDGAVSAQRIVRNHRLWEMYLISQVDIPPSHVDRDADDVEHFLPPDVIESLSRQFAASSPGGQIPASPHLLPPAEQ